MFSDFWAFIIQDQEEHFLDCKIITKDNKTMKTNKCFFISLISVDSLYLSDCQDGEMLTFIMPFHSCLEMYEALRGFCKTSSRGLLPTELGDKVQLEKDQSNEEKESLNQSRSGEEEKRTMKTFQCCHCGKFFDNYKQLKQHKYQGMG